LTERRNRAFRLSMAFVVQMMVLISRSKSLSQNGVLIH
jgi:hypothetical protein